MQDTKRLDVADEPSAEEVHEIRRTIWEIFSKMREIDRRMDSRKEEFERLRKETSEILDRLESRLDANVA